MQTQTMTIGDLIAGRYEIAARIGAGGFGAVYRARQLDLNREVAIKTMLPHLAEVEGVEERFRREAELASALSSPHTIRLFDFGKTPGGMLYMVMELLEGRELAKALKNDGPMAPGLVQKIALEILDSLDEAHDHGVVHRDLKPSNIFLARQRRDEFFVKVLDFGIAKAVSNEGNPEAQQLTATGQALGTPFYMSPEQIRGKNVGGYSDLYSLGLMMIEMLTGRIAMQGETPLDTVLLHVSDKPVPMPPWLADSPLGRVIAGATAKNWQQRYQNADHMITDLRAADLSGLGAAASAAGGAHAWKPTNAPLSGVVDSGSMPQLQSGPMSRSGVVPNGNLHTPYPAPGYGPGGMRTPQPGALHTPAPGAMYTPHSGINQLHAGQGAVHPSLLQSQELSRPASGGRGKLVVLLAIVLAVAILGGIAAFTLGGGSEGASEGGGGDSEANASTPPPATTLAADETALEPMPVLDAGDDEATALTGTDETAMAADETATAADETDDAGATDGGAGEPAAPETVSVTINSTPEGADVVRGDEVLGQTPFSFEEARADGKLQLVVARDDYDPKTVEVDLSQGGTLSVELVKVARDEGKRRSSRSERRRNGSSEAKGDATTAATTPTKTPPDDKKSDGGSEKKNGGGSLAVPD